MKQLLIIILIFPLISFSQTEYLKYDRVIDFVADSIIKNDTANFYISDSIERKTDFFDFHGYSENCEIQHKLLMEILFNGEQSKISKSELSDIIPDKFEFESKIYKIRLGTIITYKNIWATVITVRSVSSKQHEWTKYSLLYIDNQLVVKIIGKWHGE